jgi:uncharacterized protein YjbI with pentapeptide repeats
MQKALVESTLQGLLCVFDSAYISTSLYGASLYGASLYGASFCGASLIGRFSIIFIFIIYGAALTTVMRTSAEFLFITFNFTSFSSA